MVIGLVAVTIAQPPAAAIVLVTVYVPGVLAAKLICPVAVLTKTSRQWMKKFLQLHHH